MRSAAVLMVGFIVGWFAHAVDAVHAQQRSELAWTRIFTDAAGQTRFERIAASLNRSDTAPDRGWLESGPAQGAPNIQVLRTSSDYFSTFHSVASRRYIIMLSGRREYEVGGGQKFVAGPGSVVLVEDVFGTGHQTRGLGEEAVNLLIPLPDSK